MYSIYLLHWDVEKAESLSEILQSFGYQVASGPIDNKSMRQLRDDPPDIMVIDLSRKPSVGRDVAIGFRSYKNTRNMPIVFVEGEPDKVLKTQSILPDAVYTEWDQIQKALKQAIESPPAAPVVPESTMAAYSGTPLPKKLGIKPDSVVTLLNEPDGFKDMLAPQLPNGAKLQSSKNSPGDVTLWFLNSMADLEDQIAAISKQYGEQKLWIAWPKKSSGVKTDITQTLIRNTGLAAGLVDYKICSIDNTWSGLLFTRRK